MKMHGFVLARGAATPEECETFATLPETWHGMATSTESYLIRLDVADGGSEPVGEEPSHPN